MNQSSQKEQTDQDKYMWKEDLLYGLTLHSLGGPTLATFNGGWGPAVSGPLSCAPSSAQSQEDSKEITGLQSTLKGQKKKIWTLTFINNVNGPTDGNHRKRTHGEIQTWVDRSVVINFLMLRPFNTVPHGLVTPTIKLHSVLLHTAILLLLGINENRWGGWNHKNPFPSDLLGSLLPPEIATMVTSSLSTSLYIIKKIPHRCAQGLPPAQFHSQSSCRQDLQASEPAKVNSEPFSASSKILQQF